MATFELKAAKRHIEGKKVKALRRQGVTPAHLFGPGIKSTYNTMRYPRAEKYSGRRRTYPACKPEIGS